MTSNIENAPTRNCRACGSAIADSAYLCHHCGQYQDWQRFFPFSSTVLALLAAMLALLGVSLPDIKRSLTSDKTNITFVHASRDGIPVGPREGPKICMDGFQILSTNSGNRDGSIVEVIFEFRGQRLSARLPSEFMSRHDYLLEPGKTRILPYYVPPGVIPANDYRIMARYIAFDGTSKWSQVRKAEQTLTATRGDCLTSPPPTLRQGGG